MVAVAVILGLVAFVVGILYFIAATGGAWLERAREAATALGCADLPSVNKTLTEEFEVHQWTCQGVAMTLKPVPKCGTPRRVRRLRESSS